MFTKLRVERALLLNQTPLEASHDVFLKKRLMLYHVPTSLRTYYV